MENICGHKVRKWHPLIIRLHLLVRVDILLRVYRSEKLWEWGKQPTEKKNLMRKLPERTLVIYYRGLLNILVILPKFFQTLSTYFCFIYKL